MADDIFDPNKYLSSQKKLETKFNPDEYIGNSEKKQTEGSSKGLQNTSQNVKPTSSNAGLTDLSSITNSGSTPITPAPLTTQGQATYVAPKAIAKPKIDFNRGIEVFKADNKNKSELYSEDPTLATKREQDNQLKLQNDGIITPAENFNNKAVNFGVTMRQIIPQLSLITSKAFQKSFDKSIINSLYSLPRINYSSENGFSIDSGMTIEEVQQQSLNKLEELSKQSRDTNGLIDSALNPMGGNLASAIAGSVIDLAGTAVPKMLSGGTSLPVQMIGASLYDYNKKKAEVSGKTIQQLYKDGEDEVRTPIVLGSAAVALEYIGLKGVSNAMTKKLTGSFLKKAATFSFDTNLEGMANWLQTGLEKANEIKAIGGTDEDATVAAVDALFSRDGLEQYLQGTTGSFASASIGRAFSKGGKESLDAVNTKTNELLNDLKNPSLDTQTKDVIIDKIAEQKEQEAKIIKVEQELKDNLPEEIKQEVIAKQDELANLTEQAQTEGISETTKQILIEKATTLETEINTLIGTATPQQSESTNVETSIEQELADINDRFNKAFENLSDKDYEILSKQIRSKWEDEVKALQEKYGEDVVGFTYYLQQRNEVIADIEQEQKENEKDLKKLFLSNKAKEKIKTSIEENKVKLAELQEGKQILEERLKEELQRINNSKTQQVEQTVEATSNTPIEEAVQDTPIVEAVSPVSEVEATRTLEQVQKDQKVLTAKFQDVLKEQGLFEDARDSKLTKEQIDGAVKIAEEQTGLSLDGLKKEAVGVTPKASTKLETAKERLTKAREAKKASGLGIANDPKQNAKVLFEEHSAMVDYAKEWIADKADKTVKSIENFAKELGETMSKALTDAWDEASGGKVINEASFEGVAPRVSGIKKGLVSDELIAQVNLDKIGDLDMLQLAEQLFKSGEVKPLEIIEEIAGSRIGDKVIEGTPRALQPKEVVGLIGYKTDLDNRYEKALKEYSSKLEAGEDTSNLDKDIAKLQDEVYNYNVMSVITAQQQSLAFRLRQYLLDSNFNLVTFVEQYKKDNKGDISPEQLAEFTEMSKKLDALQTELKDIYAKEQEIAEQVSVSNIVESVGKETKKPIGEKLIKYTKEKDDAVAALKKAIRVSLGQLNTGGSLNLIGEFTNVVKAYAKLGIVKIEDVTKQAVKDFGKKFIKDNSDALNQAHVDANTKKVQSPEQKRKTYITKLKKDILSLDEQIDAGERKVVVKEDKYKNDEEIKKLRETRDAKKQELDVVDPAYKEQVKLKQDLASAEKSLKEYQRKLDEKDFETSEKSPPKEVVKQLQDLRDARDKVKDEYEVSKKVYEESLITPEERAQAEVDREIKKTETAITELQKKIDGKVVTPKQTSIWTKEIGELKQKQEQLKKDLKAKRDSEQKPYIAKDGSLIIPNEYIREQVRNGVVDIEGLTKAVKDEVSKDLPQITDREVRDAITNYGKEVNQTKDAIATQINTAKRIGKAYSKLEDLAKGKREAKTAKEVNVISKQEQELKKQIKALEKALPKTEQEINFDIKAYEKSLQTQADKLKARIANNELTVSKTTTSKYSPTISKLKQEIKADRETLKKLQDDAGITDVNKNNARRNQLSRYVLEKQRQLSEGDFTVKKPTTYKKDTKTREKEIEAQLIRDEFETAKYVNEQANRSTLKKTYDISIETITGLQRGIVAGGDMGSVFLQSMLTFMSQNPAKSFKQIVKSIKGAKNEKSADESIAELRLDPDYYKAKLANLGLQEPNQKFGNVDSALQGGVINAIYNAVTYPLIIFDKLTGKPVYQTVKDLNIYAAGERFYTVNVNTVRMDLFKEFVAGLEKQGFTVENDLAEFKRAANLVNNFTLRGRLRNFEPVAKELGVLLFAPRKVTATFSLLNPYYWGSLGYTNKYLAKEGILRMATAMTTLTTLIILGNAVADDDDENKDIFNPYSPDFMAYKIGNTRIDPFVGMKQNLVFITRFLGGMYKSTSSAETKKLGTVNVPTRKDLIYKFVESKASPSAGVFLKLLGEREGMETDWNEEFSQSSMSMWMSNMKELQEEHPTEMTSLLTMFAIIGVGESTYGGAEFVDPKDPKDSPIIQLFKTKGMSVYTPTRPNVKIYDRTIGEKRTVEATEYETYKKTYDAYFKEAVNNKMSELRALSVSKFENEIKKIKGDAKLAGERSVGLGKRDLMLEVKSKNYELTPNQIKQMYSYIDEYKQKKEYENLRIYYEKQNKTAMRKGGEVVNIEELLMDKAVKVAKDKVVSENTDKDNNINIPEK